MFKSYCSTNDGANDENSEHHYQNDMVNFPYVDDLRKFHFINYWEC